MVSTAPTTESRCATSTTVAPWSLSLRNAACRADSPSASRCAFGSSSTTSRGSPKSAKDLFFKKKELDEVQSMLACGALLGGSLERPYQAVIAKLAALQQEEVGDFRGTTGPRGHHPSGQRLAALVQ